MTDPRAAIYSRVSTARQEYETQMRILRKYCAARGWPIVMEFSEETSAGPKGEQDQFNAMIAAASRREFDVLVFWSWDRVTRKGPPVAFKIMAQLDGFGLAYHSHQEPFASSDSPVKDLLLPIVAWVARYEREHHSARVAAWHSQKAALQQPHGRRKGSKDRRPRTRRWRKKPATMDPLVTGGEVPR